MPLFNDPQAVDQLCYELKLGDWTRGQNRARINQLFNGFPPYSESEVQESGITVNVNSLEGTTIAHDARSQFYGAFLKPGFFFRASTDMGPAHKRQSRSSELTRIVNRPMKRSLDYFECFRSKFALNVLHGIGPGVWADDDHWCPDGTGIEDVLIPGKTLLTFKNLPLFAIYHSFTAPELIKLTRGPDLDPGWNLPLVEDVINWVDSETLELLGSTWPEIWSPEKLQERVKGDGGFYPGDTAPTVDCFDFYFWADDGEKSGWRRRIILDSWGAPAANGYGPGGKLAYRMDRRVGTLHEKGGKRGFLYTSGNRNVADKWQHLVSFQFADLSAVGPFQYHSVRGLGFLMYAVCHLQNRMRCRFSESVFEALLNYFRVKSADDFQRALKVEIANRGFIDDSINFVRPDERWQVNEALVLAGLDQNNQLISRHASSWTSNPEAAGNKKDITATQWIGEAQNTTQLVGAALNQAYHYQVWEYREILRRFFRRGSKDPDVIAAQGAMLRAGIPPEMWVEEAWDLEPERLMGNGNMNLEMAISNWLMQNREKYDPDAQREILRKATFSVTSDPGFADLLVPEEKVISDSTHDAQLAAATLLMGLPMALKQGVNHQEYAQALLAAMLQQIQKITQSQQGVANPDQLAGLQNLAGQTIQGAPIQGNGARNHIQVLAGNPNEKQTVKQLGDQLGKMMNLVKAFAQRLMEQQKKQSQQQGGQMDPKEQAKIAAIQAESQQDMQIRKESHAQRTAQRQLQWEAKMKQDQQKHQQELAKEQQRHAAGLAALDLETVHNMRMNQFAATEE
jgi:hypothetical protein